MKPVDPASINELVKILSAQKLPTNPESATQDAIQHALELAGIEFSREHRLSDMERIDFLALGRIGIEVKVQGAPRSIYRQLERYAELEVIQCLILVSSRAMGKPATVKNKPLFFVSIGRAWL